MGKRKRGHSGRNSLQNQCANEPEEVTKAPHTFVINRGKLGNNANELMMNFRKIMEPFTATHLKVQKHNVLKDFVHMAGPLNVSHLVIFTKSTNAMYLRLGKLAQGPTLTFQIKEYCLSKDVISSQKKSAIYEKLFEHHPLLVLNNFSGEGMHLKLMATTFQNMFPSINVNKTNLNTIRRCLLLNRDSDGMVDLRHYAVKVVPTGVSRAVKKLIQNKVPDLGKLQNLDDFLHKSGNLSESEAELDTAANIVVLPQPISSRGNMASEKSAIRLYEIGPRLKIQLVKIEEGLMTGEVLFHEFVTKTPEEIKALRKKIAAKKKLKAKRKEQQNKNVERKKVAFETKNDERSREEEQKEDLDWYRKEVGEEPDDSVLSHSIKRKIFDSSKRLSKHKISFGNKPTKESSKKKMLRKNSSVK